MSMTLWLEEACDMTGSTCDCGNLSLLFNLGMSNGRSLKSIDVELPEVQASFCIVLLLANFGISNGKSVKS